MLILRVTKENIKYHAIQVKTCSKSDIEIFTSSNVDEVESESVIYLIDRILEVEAEDWVVKDKDGNLRVCKNMDMYYSTIQIGN